mgnify:CR=1 FL=1
MVAFAVRTFAAENVRLSEKMEETRARLAELEEQTAALACRLVHKDRRRASVELLQSLVQPPISTSTVPSRGARSASAPLRVSGGLPKDCAALTGLKRGGCVSVMARAKFCKYSMSDVPFC